VTKQVQESEMNTGKDTQVTAERERVQTLRPPVDVMEDEHGIALYADMPGVASEDLNISVEDKVLRIEADAKLDTPADMKAVYAEFRTPRYVREFSLSSELDAQKIDATLRNGLLVLKIPKHEHARPRKISVNVR
jgi:HSP20 family protein